MKTRIICVGNRYASGDDTGPRVFDFLARKPPPEDVEIIDGGLSGLNLLGLVEDAKRVIFVDSISGFGRQGEVVVMDGMEAGSETSMNYGHSGGLSYLLRVLPEVIKDELPEVLLVGVEGLADDQTIACAADTCMRLIMEG